MESVDWCIGQLLAGMTPQTRANTMIIRLWGDNGTVANAIPPGFPHSKRRLPRRDSGAHARARLAGGRAPTPAERHDPRRGRVRHSARHHRRQASADGGRLRRDLVLAGDPEPDRQAHAAVRRGIRSVGATEPSQLVNLQRAIYDGRWRYVVRQGQTQLFDNHPTSSRSRTFSPATSTWAHSSRASSTSSPRIVGGEDMRFLSRSQARVPRGVPSCVQRAHGCCSGAAGDGRADGGPRIARAGGRSRLRVAASIVIGFVMPGGSQQS